MALPIFPNFSINLKSNTKPILARISNGSVPATASPSPKQYKPFQGKPEADVVVIGSGIGGLCCSGLLARYQQDVLVLESHDRPGGAAHSFKIRDYEFDSGPSLFSGFQSRGPQANPLAQVLEKYGSRDAVREWEKLLDAVLPMSAAAMALRPPSIRGYLGVISTAATRYAPPLLKSFVQMGPQGALGATKLLRPLSEIMDSLDLKDSFIRNWVDLLAFMLAGVKSNGILSVEMVYMFAEWYKPGCTLEYPLQGTGAVVDALVGGMQKFGGRLSLESHVEKIVVENDQAIGVKLRSGQFIRAKKAVVSNASMWDTLNLLPKEAVPKSYQDRMKTAPQCESCMHLHLGFDAEICVYAKCFLHVFKTTNHGHKCLYRILKHIFIDIRDNSNIRASPPGSLFLIFMCIDKHQKNRDMDVIIISGTFCCQSSSYITR
ncbi:hypothetical protein PVL29_016198 [Vitis rotundifolia]|uniref:Amine oxidase domain-containing protein n=1 Tax=Vitis rotundifolia TaxID=103349 RepID=A0AA38ZEL0_VITRO|nr:hypothetical protein PVL29_016198 [Vitis rotundifolia]